MAVLILAAENTSRASPRAAHFSTDIQNFSVQIQSAAGTLISVQRFMLPRGTRETLIFPQLNETTFEGSPRGTYGVVNLL